MPNPSPDILIAGGGLAGCLVALALAEQRRDLSVMVLEQGPTFGGQHVWSFFDTDLDPGCRRLVESLLTRRWRDHEIAFPARRRTIGIGYNSIRSAQLDTVMRERLDAASYRLNFEIGEVASDHVTGSNAECIDAKLVLDARGPGAMPGLSLGWQKFVGRTYRFAEPHRRIRPMIMDATVEQVDGYRFAYLLPFDDHDALIEDTYYSDDPHLEASQLGADLDAMASAIGEAVTVDQEVGVLPVVLGGEVADLWNGAAAPLLGIRGGFFHPTTGYSLPDAARNALLLARQTSFDPAHIHALLRRLAERLWQERSFFRLLNRMLFKAAEPAQRYRVLEHFYRLPDATIGRFYAAQLTLFDKARILSGRPPVPISRALRAVRGAAA